jgi:hypothetical protein
MADHTTRPAALVLAAIGGSFLSGPLIGVMLARSVAPESWLADAVGLFMLPLAFTVGLQIWLGTAIVTAMVQIIVRLASGRPWRAAGGAAMRVPAGSIAFVPVAAAAGLLGGVLVGLVSDTHSVPACVALYGGASALYGVLVWQLARAGYLPCPEPVL